MASKAERDARLDALAASVEKWAKERRKNIDDRVASSKAILKGRTGADRLAQKGVEAASELVVNEIDEFLVTT